MLLQCTTVLATLFAASLVTACGSDSATGPSTAQLAGTYDAVAFTIDDGTGPHDLLVDGASIHLVLNEDGSTGGNLFVPGSDVNGDDLDVDLTGTWSLSGARVQLSQPADTFLRDVSLQAQGTHLIGDGDLADVSVHVDLLKQ